MKISDLQSYQTPQIISKKKNSREKTKLSAINSIGQKVVDVAISSTIRFLVFIALFKLAMTMVPKNIIQEIALAVTPVEIFAVVGIGNGCGFF